MSNPPAKISGNHRRLSSRLQLRAPSSIKITPATDWNVAIPFLSPLAGSPTSDSTAEMNTKEEDSRRDCNNNNNNSVRKTNEAEKAPATLVCKKWQHPAAPFCYNESPPMRPFMFCMTVSDRS